MLLHHACNCGISQLPQQVGAGAGMVFIGFEASGFRDIMKKGRGLNGGKMKIAAPIICSLRNGNRAKRQTVMLWALILGSMPWASMSLQAFLSGRYVCMGSYHERFFKKVRYYIDTCTCR